MSTSAVVWTEEARARVERAPAFVRAGIRALTERRARERGRAVITSEFLTEIRNESMLRVAKCIRGFGFEELSMEAFEVAKAKMRRHPRKLAVIGEIEAYLAGRAEKNEVILAKFARYLEMIPERGLPWTEEALARLDRVPEAARDMVREVGEAQARRRGEPVVTPEALSEAMGVAAATGTRAGTAASDAPPGLTMRWEPAAAERLNRIPIPAVRDLVARRVEARARTRGLDAVDLATYAEAAGGPPPGVAGPGAG